MNENTVKIKRRFDLVEVENGWLVRENNGMVTMSHGLPPDRMWTAKRVEDIPFILNEAMASDDRGKASHS